MLALLVIMVLADRQPGYAADSRWALVNPPLTGSALKDVYFISPSTGWIVGQGGIILNTRDSGSTWTIQPTPVEYPGTLFSVAFIDKDTGYAVGGAFGRTFALKTHNGGLRWIDASLEFPQGGIRRIHIKGNMIWVQIWRKPYNIAVTRNRCASWESYTIGPGSIDDILFIDDSIGFACGDRGFIAKTTNAGVYWEKCSDTLTGVFYRLQATGNRIYALGWTSGNLVVSQDTGRTWIGIVKTSMQLNAMHFIPGNNVYVDDGFVIGSYNPNKIISFRNVSPTTNPPNLFESTIQPQVSAMALPQPDRGIGVCWNGAIHRIFGLADSSYEITRNTGGHIGVMDFGDSLHGICVVGDGTLLITSNAGATWERTVRNIPEIRWLACLGKGKAVAGTGLPNAGFGQYITFDNGKTWSLAGNTDIRAIYKDGPWSSTLYANGNSGIVCSKDGGLTWGEPRGSLSFANQRPRDGFGSMYFNNRGAGWAVSKYGAVCKTLDSGYNWIPVGNIPDSIITADIFFLDSLNGWVCGQWGSFSGPLLNSRIYRTGNGGATWMRQENINFNWNLQYLAHPIDWPFQANVLKIRAKDFNFIWALTDKGVLLSTDTGNTWQQQTLPQYASLFFNMALQPNGEVIAVGDNSRIWKLSSTAAGIRYPGTQRRIIHISGMPVLAEGIAYDVLGRKIYVGSGSGIAGISPVPRLASGFYVLGTCAANPVGPPPNAKKARPKARIRSLRKAE